MIDVVLAVVYIINILFITGTWGIPMKEKINSLSEKILILEEEISKQKEEIKKIKGQFIWSDESGEEK